MSVPVDRWPRVFDLRNLLGILFGLPYVRSCSRLPKCDVGGSLTSALGLAVDAEIPVSAVPLLIAGEGDSVERGLELSHSF